MARDRQRAKQRRKRQGGPAQRGGAAARSRTAREIGLDDATADDAGLGEATPAPDPLRHASADVDQAKLAEAGATLPADDLPSSEIYSDELEDDDFERAPDEAEADLVPATTAGEHAAEVAPRRRRGRVLTFHRHCADELRRVQWPNRRQVGQATAVVLGFVVLAGGYLGLLDALWKPIIDAIL
jgi:preprotein translocase subunit SecE